MRRARRAFRSPTPPPHDRLEFILDDVVAAVRFRTRFPGRRLNAIVLEDRSGEVFGRIDPGQQDESGHYEVQVNVADLAARHDLRGRTVNWHLEWQHNSAGTLTRRRLGTFPEMRREARAYRTVLYPGGPSGEPLDVQFDSTIAGNLSLRFGAAAPIPLRADVTKHERSARYTTVTADVLVGNRAPREVQLVAWGRSSQVAVEFPGAFDLLEAESAAGSGHLRYRMRGTIDLVRLADQLPESVETLDLEFQVRWEAGTSWPEDDPTSVRLHVESDGVARSLRSAAVDVGDRTFQFIPYLTFRKHRLTYRVERFATADYRYLQRLLRLAWAFPIVKPFYRIWLIGEVPYKAQDNGYHFFHFVRKHYPQRRAYFVIDAASPDRPRVAALGHVVDRFSREHIKYSLLASRLIGSHHAEFLFASRDKRVVRYTRGVRIFLQHGITATKNVTLNYARQGTFELPTEKFLVVSDLERRIVTEDYGYAAHQVAVTGFARYDALFADVPIPDRVITVMPTWREALQRSETFQHSDYYANWHGFLADPVLQRLLTDRGYRIRFVLHPNMRAFADHFDLPNVTLIRQEDIDVQQVIRSSAALITDFSSVAWDFSFLQRPVLYFQFDLHDLIGPRAPHIDFGAFLPGPIATTRSALIHELAETLASDAAMKPLYWQRAQRFCARRDQQNCARIFETVQKAWNLRTALARVRNTRSVQRAWHAFRHGEHYFSTMQKVFAVARRLPRRNVVVFECDRGAHYGDSPRYLYERLITRTHHMRIIWSSNTTLRLTDPSTTKIRRHSPRYYWELGRARYWINNQNFPSALVRPPHTRFLQTWHGTPLKRMQHDVENMLSRDPDYQARAARLTSYWSALVAASPYATACFRSAFRYTGSIYELGYPRNDVFRWNDAHERAAATRERLGLKDDPRKIMFYAPTFRDDNRRGVNWRHELALDIDRLAAEFGDEWVLVVRFHQLVRQNLSISDHARDFVVDGSAYDDVQELLLVSDVLITDYSSLFFDFAQLGRPILFFAYDLDTYRDKLRGFYLDFEADAPGPLLRDNDTLIAALHDLQGVTRRYYDRVASTARTYGPRDDGGASDRVLDAFFELAQPGSSPATGRAAVAAATASADGHLSRAAEAENVPAPSEHAPD